MSGSWEIEDQGALTSSNRGSTAAAYRLILLLNLIVLVLWLLLFRWRDRFYVDPAAGPLSVWGVAFYLGQALLLWGVVPFGAALLRRVGLPRRAVLVVIAGYFGVLYIYLYVDLVVASLFQRHLTWYWLKLLAEPTAWTDLGLGAGELAAIGAGVIGITALQLVLFAVAARRPPAIARRLPALTTVALWGVLFGGASYLGWSAYFHHDALRAAQDARMIPLYLPRESRWGLRHLWSAIGVRRGAVVLSADVARQQQRRSIERRSYQAFRAHYRLPQQLKAAQRYNIIVVGAESWRWDTLSAENMPRLWDHAQHRGWRARAHFSTGNTTPEGIFGIFSGLSPFFWQVCKEQRLTPLFLAILRRLGYRTSVYTANNFAYRDSDRYVFGEMVDRMRVFDAMKNAKSTRRWKKRALEREDRATLRSFVADLGRRDRGTPTFDLLYFYAPHYNYYYPERMARFSPSMPSDFSIHDFDIRSKAPRLHNRYRNSVYFLDALIGELLDQLQRSGRLKHTIVLLTGDHGEEFFERGRFGHSVGLNNFQLRVPLVIFAPRRFQSRYNISSHADLVPTLLSLLGVDLPLGRLFSGKDLARYSAERDRAVIASMEGQGVLLDYALVTPRFRAHFVNFAERVVLQRTYSFDGTTSHRLSVAERQVVIRAILKEKRHFVDVSRPSTANRLPPRAP